MYNLVFCAVLFCKSQFIPIKQQAWIMSLLRCHPILKSFCMFSLYHRYEVYFEDHGVSFNKPSNFSRSILTLTSCQILIRLLSLPVIAVLISIPVMSFGRLHFHISKMSMRASSWEDCMSMVYCRGLVMHLYSDSTVSLVLMSDFDTIFMCLCI